MPKRDRILVIEDSAVFAKVIRHSLENAGGFDVHVVATMADAKAYIEEHWQDIFLCVIDLILPDSPDGEVFDYVSSAGLSSIIFTSKQDEKLHNAIARLKAIDYVIKGVPTSLDHLVTTVKRIAANRGKKVLVVEPDRAMRLYIGNLMRLYRFTVLEAADGERAFDLLADNPDISLVLTDAQLPNMDGFAFVRSIREAFPKDELPIIGLSDREKLHYSSKFIKMGANDFLKKPFQPEEFFCRINQNLEVLDTVRALRRAANTDYLTGLTNRRRFFEIADSRFAAALKRKEDGGPGLLVGILDIDHFKQVNDTYGHDTGDLVLIEVSARLEAALEPHGTVARLGGEEFAFMLSGLPMAELVQIIDRFRSDLAATAVQTENRELTITISIGACEHPASDFRKTLTQADQHLYIAKATGRNRTVTENTSIETAAE